MTDADHEHRLEQVIADYLAANGGWGDARDARCRRQRLRGGLGPVDLGNKDT
jgi:hypothetical protein